MKWLVIQNIFHPGVDQLLISSQGELVQVTGTSNFCQLESLNQGEKLKVGDVQLDLATNLSFQLPADAPVTVEQEASGVHPYCE